MLGSFGKNIQFGLKGASAVYTCTTMDFSV